jgi:hypothetical protein
LKLTRIEYSELVALMNKWLRFAPPKVKLATVSGTWRFPISVPSGSEQCSPSPAAAQIRPRASRSGTDQAQLWY